MGCPTTTVKISSIIINVLFALISIAAIILIAANPSALPADWVIPAYITFAFVILFGIIGIVAALRESICLTLLSIAAIILIAANPSALPADWVIPAYAFVILFGIIGIVAALRESICLTVTCSVFLLILAILQIIVTIIVLNERHAQSGIALVENAWDHDEMHSLQTDYLCCGKDSSQDYILLNRQIPTSCYEGQNDADANKMFTEGCSAKVQRFYDNATTSIAISSWVIVGFEIVGFLLAVFFVINFRNKQRRMQF